MGIKAKIKKILGYKNLQRIKHLKARAKYVKTNLPGRGQRFVLHSEHWQQPKVFSLPERHVFFGYYDIQQLNPSQDKMLVTVVAQKADTRKDMAQLKWVDLSTGEYHDIAKTKAWCWQQGARLRWHPVQDDVVLYNDVQENRYVTRAYDLCKNCEIAVFPRAFYDITPDFRYGLSLNYSRLQRLRPGYGYNSLADATENQKVPENDGIILVDLNTSQEKLIVSYEQLIRLTPEAAKEWNYINHISISPDGKRFIFFHLWVPQIGARWHAKLYTAKIDGSELTCLEDEYITSHYCWRNGNELLTTSVGFGGSESHYLVYDIHTGTRKILSNEHLKKDGHPTYMNDGDHFITDTYPLEGCMQQVFCDSVEKEDYERICDIYSDPRMFDEKRCDLHPRLTPDNQIFTIDTTYQSGSRSVLLFKHK